MPTTNSTGPKKATQSQLEEAVAKQLNKLLPNLLGKVLKEQLGGLVGQNVNRPKTKGDILLERKQFLLEEVERVDIELEELEASGEIGQISLQNVREEYIPSQRPTSAYNTVTQDKVDGAKYQEALARSREQMRQRHGGKSQEIGGSTINEEAIWKNVASAGSPNLPSVSSLPPMQEAKINRKIETVIGNPHLSEQERMTLALVLGTEGASAPPLANEITK